VKKFFARLGRFFVSWAFVKFVMWMITLIILFYAEEDWRGARAWAATKAKWEARGESFDYAKFDPPPAPAEENLAALPIFAVDPKSHRPEGLAKAMGAPMENYPKIGNFLQDEAPDLTAIQAEVWKNFSATFPGTSAPEGSLAQFERLYPFIVDLRAAIVTRPLCRFDGNYEIFPPENRALSSIVEQMKLARLVVLNALLALHQNQPDLALADLKLNYRLAAGTERDPSLVGGLVANGIEAMSGNAVAEGLRLHLWSDAQLAAIQEGLSRFDLLRVFQFDLRADASSIGPNYDFLKNNRQLTLANWPTANNLRDLAGLQAIVLKLSLLWPSGWFDFNKVPITDSMLSCVAVVDPLQRRVFPEMAADLDRKLERRLAEVDALAPWNFISIDAGMAITGPAQGFARNQVIVLDETRIACALERYRMAHGIYPAALDALAPEFIDSIPHDIMNGEPLHYQLRPDGNFLLYSVGWNQRDDGGKTVIEKKPSTKIDYFDGDWVWPQPKVSP
jgi:hypothetical protein